MAEKQIISVGAVSSADDIQGIFVNAGTDIAQATPDLLLEAMDDWEDITSELSLDSTKVTNTSVKMLKKGRMRFLCGAMEIVSIAASTALIGSVGAANTPISPTAITVAPTTVISDLFLYVQSSNYRITYRSGTARTSGSLRISAFWITA